MTDPLMGIDMPWPPWVATFAIWCVESGDYELEQLNMVVGCARLNKAFTRWASRRIGP